MTCRGGTKQPQLDHGHVRSSFVNPLLDEGLLHIELRMATGSACVASLGRRVDTNDVILTDMTLFEAQRMELEENTASLNVACSLLDKMLTIIKSNESDVVPGPICKSDLDEAMEITRSTWCRACSEHMAETPAVNPDAGQEVFKTSYVESKGQGPKDKARPQGTEEALGKRNSTAEESVEATDDDKVVPEKVDHNDPAESCSIDDATEEGTVDLAEKGKGQGAGGTSVENFESKAKVVKKYVEVSDSESTSDFEHGVIVHYDENETASNPQSDREEYEELDNYDDDDGDYEAGEVVQFEDEGE
ncbi:unnamed protein product [Lampetra planeri]